MSKWFNALFFSFLTLSFYSQIFEPAKWSFDQKEIAPNTYELMFIANIEEGWHLYSQFIQEGGPIPTSFDFKENKNVKLIGKVQEPKGINTHDEMFDMSITWFDNSARFVQKVKVLETTDVKGEITYMVCDHERCLPPEYKEFTFNLVFEQAKKTKVEDTNPTIEKTALSQHTSKDNSHTALNTENRSSTPEVKTPERKIDTQTSTTSKDTTKSSSSELQTHNFSFYKSSVRLDHPKGECQIKEAEVKNSSIWQIFVLGFLGGLLALLTPCVFPMIPLTVSFFTKDTKGKGLRNAVLYGGFILMVYLLLSVPFHLLDSIDPNILNTISTNVYLNVFFFIIFLFFAFSFFGFYEITLPSSLANKADSASSVGGIGGIFFMALTLALVSFSCTGPILGSLLAGSLSSSGGAMQLTSGMAGFGLALALPFGFFAAFPKLLNALPKSGGWLSDVKIILGFIELALAFKFLSNADLVKHWNILPFELFIGIWIAIALATVLYLLNVLKFPHASPFKSWSVLRIFLVVFFAGSTIYLLSGFRYNSNTNTFTSLPLLSGLAPPTGYSWIYPSKCPLGLPCFKDYDKALVEAKKQTKPLMVDFTGHACVNCRKMEENVWSNPEIFKLIRDKYILVSLYVDDRQALPKDQQHTYNTKRGREKKIRTIGDKWATFQTETFDNNSQPWYPLLSPDEELLLSAVGNTPEIPKFKAYLECGLQTFSQIK